MRRVCATTGGMNNQDGKIKYDADGNEIRFLTDEQREAENEAAALEDLKHGYRPGTHDPDGPKATSLGSGRGKIARLPGPLRHEVCHRLPQEPSGGDILSSTNAPPEVQ